MRCGKTTTQPPPPLYTVRVKRQLKNKDREKRERGRERWRGNRCACTHVSKQRAPPRGLPHSPRTRDTRTRVPTVCGVTVLVKVDTTPRDRQARYISSPLPNRCLKATIYYVGGAVGPWTTRLSSSHLPGPTHSVPLLVSVPLVSGQEGEEEGEEETSKRSHRPRVVAGIPGADFICRMSTSRGPRGRGRNRGDAECDGTEREGESEELRGHGTRIGPRPDSTKRQLIPLSIYRV